MPKLSYIFISYDCYPAPIAKMLIEEGNTVWFSQVDRDDLGVESGWTKKEDPEEDKRRKSIYDGLLPKLPIERLIEEAKKIENKDNWFCVFDFNVLYKIADKFLAMGFTKGLFPTKEDFELEKDREKGKTFVKKYFKGVDVAELHEFKQVKDAIQFLDENGSSKIYALKSEGNYVDTTVPLTDDPDFAKQELIFKLMKDKKDYEKGGFILEEKIVKPVEIVPQLTFWNGKLIATNVEMETRLIGAGEVGFQTGGNQSLCIATEKSSKIFKIFPKIVFDMAKKRKGLFIFDCGLLYDQKGTPHFMEFCGNRWGWGTIFCELSMSRANGRCASEYFEAIVTGKNPYKYKYGTYLSFYNLKADGEHPDCFKEGLPFQWKKVLDPYFFPYQIKKTKEFEQEMIVNTGYTNALVGWTTGCGNTLDDAANQMYDIFENNVSFNGLIYRPREDYFSTYYNAAIKNRVAFLKKHDLITVATKLGETFENVGDGTFIVDSDRFDLYKDAHRKSPKFETYMVDDIGEAIKEFARNNPNSQIMIHECDSERKLYLKYGRNETKSFSSRFKN